MSSTPQSKSTDKNTKSPAELNGTNCEVSSSSKVSEFKCVQSVKAKENTEVAIETAPGTENTKLDAKAAETKMSSDATTRNPLTESAIPPNNDTNRKSSSGSENKTPKTSAPVQNETNNNSKLRARPGKKSTSPTQMYTCGWCSDNKPILKYVLPTLSGENLEFCSEGCIAEFRKAVKKGACKQCGNAIRPAIAPNKEYCSTYCLNKAMPKNGKKVL